MSKPTPPTLAQIAAAAGVSAMTASRALNQQPGVSAALRTMIQQLAAEMGYVGNRSAQRLASSRGSGGPVVANRPLVIGVLAPDPGAPFVGALLDALARQTAARGDGLLVSPLPEPSPEPPQRALALLTHSCDALLALRPAQFGLVEALAEAGLPVLAIEDAHTPDPRLPAVAPDGALDARGAMAQLLALGHRRIALLGGDPMLDASAAQQQAWHDALQLAGIAPQADWLLQGEPHAGGGAAAAARLCAMAEPPTAVLVHHADAALGLCAALQAAGWALPQQLSVLALADAPGADRVWPAIAVWRADADVLAGAALDQLRTTAAGLALAQPLQAVAGRLDPRESLTTPWPAPAQAPHPAAPAAGPTPVDIVLDAPPTDAADRPPAPAF
ncbi:MAG: hypothetical protein RLY78_3060 [Pseudomonadota bacterium]